MKTNLILGFIALLGIGLSAQAQGFYEETPESSGYLEVDGGGVIAPDFTLTSFAGTSLHGAKASLDPGSRFDILGGWQLARDFSVELNSGVLFNSVDKVGGFPISPDHFDIWQTPLMVNLVYTIPTDSPFKIYFGGGGGGVFTSIDYRLTYYGHIRDTDATFGYQALAGVKYQIGDHMEIGVGYKFMGTANHSWSDGGIDITANAILSHAILATFTFQF
jgi:opacity protein-like surface antigen